MANDNDSPYLDSEMNLRPRTALLSATDKTGIVEFAKFLASYGVKLISTGGTLKILREAGLEVTAIEEMPNGAPPILDGRVKTLQYMIHAGILADKENPEHMEELKKRGIDPIDIVVSNLYDFGGVSIRTDKTDKQKTEEIDIGGPTLQRAAAKNHRSVAVVTDPDDYSTIMDDMEDTGGSIRLGTRWEMAIKVFAGMAEYDRKVANWMVSTTPAELKSGNRDRSKAT